MPQSKHSRALMAGVVCQVDTCYSSDGGYKSKACAGEMRKNTALRICAGKSSSARALLSESLEDPGLRPPLGLLDTTTWRPAPGLTDYGLYDHDLARS